MQSIPFRLFVVNELDLQDPRRSKQYFGHPLGVVDGYGCQAGRGWHCQPLWKSKAGATYPQELGLILLSGSRTAIKSMRLSVDCARAPSQIAIFTNVSTQQGDGNGRRSLDAVSRYFSTEWKPCCKPLVLEACSSAMLDTVEEIDRMVSLDIRECSFLKLVIHAPHESSRNQSHQVVLENIELLGLTEDLNVSRAIPGGNNATNRVFGRIHRPELLHPADDNEELQVVLLDAGIPMDLVAQLISISEAKMPALPLEYCKSQVADNSEAVPESSSEGRTSAALPGSTSAGVLETNDDDREISSPFDCLLRQYVEQAAREKAVLEDILATKLCERKDDISTWQTPTISPTDPANTVEITLYTFGVFFTQCLLCGGSDIQVMCVQMAERYARLLVQVIGPTSVFEGMVALIVLAIREAESSRVFQAAVHLAHSVFLTKVTNTKNDIFQPQLPTPESIAALTDTGALGLIDDISRANWSYGLRIILEWCLAGPFCWLITAQCGGKTSQPTSSCRHKPSFRSANAPPSIDRGFLQFVRLLIEQDLSRVSFFDELLVLEPADTVAGSILATNRLRLFRLVLRNEIIRCQLSTNVRNGIQSLCSRYVDSTNTTGDLSRGVNNDLLRLATECLDEISRTNSSTPQNNTRKTYTKSVRKHIEDSNNSHSHHTHCHRHTPLFIQYPLTNAEASKFAMHLQRYLVSQPRPHALYRHAFVHANEIVPDMDGKSSTESFRKGNIAFEGHVIARTPPNETFHDKIQRNTAPFVFDIGTSVAKKPPTAHSPQPAEKQQIVSSFATFRGIIEKRSDPPKRSSKVSPDETAQITPTAPTPRTTFKTAAEPSVKIEEPTTSFATRTPVTISEPAGTNIAKSPVQGMNSPPDSTPAHQILSSSSPLDSQPTEVAAAVEQEKAKPDDKKQLNNSKPPDRTRKDADKGKTKGRGKQDAKGPDNCVLQ